VSATSAIADDDDHHGSKMRPYAEVQCAATNRLVVTVPLLEKGVGNGDRE
jgi:hypothetical protein